MDIYYSHKEKYIWLKIKKNRTLIAELWARNKHDKVQNIANNNKLVWLRKTNTILIGSTGVKINLGTTVVRLIFGLLLAQKVVSQRNGSSQCPVYMRITKSASYNEILMKLVRYLNMPTKNKCTMVAVTTESSFDLQQGTTIFQDMRLLLCSVTEIGFFCFKRVGER